MGKDIISSLGKINFFKSKVNYYFLEKSKSLKKIQKNIVFFTNDSYKPLARRVIRGQGGAS